MRDKQIGMALVKNKENEIIGIITVEDIVEEKTAETVEEVKIEPQIEQNTYLGS